jgi:hypothetical protein
VNTHVQAELQLPSYYTIGAKIGLERQQYDTREIAFSGVPFERVDNLVYALFFGTDPSRRLQATGDVFAIRTLGRGPFEPELGIGWDLAASWRPHDRLETRLDGAYGRKPQGPRWVETREDGPEPVAIFGVQDPEFLSLTLRQQLVFTPRLTAQLYVQLFSSAIRWGPRFYEASLAGRRRVSLADLVESDATPDPRSHEAVVNLNAVVRWEYRLGSTLFFVYTRSQSELPGAVGTSLAAPRLFRGPLSETLLVKLSYWWNR